MAASTYLQLCQKAARECLVTQSTGVPAAVTIQTGDLLRIVGYVADAWTEIQNRHPNWRWMRSSFTVNTVASDDSYAYGDCTDTQTAVAIARFSRWWANDKKDPFKCYLQSSGVGTEYWLSYVPWERFKRVYKIGSQTASSPTWVSIDHNNNIRLGPAPNDIFVVGGDYQRSAQVFTADADVHDMPTQYESLIVYETMKKYGAIKNAPEIFSRGEREAAKLMRQLEADQLPRIRMGGPLA